MPKPGLTYRQIQYGSPEYRSSLELRQRVMRLPLGLDLYKDDLSHEPEYAHFAAIDEHGVVRGVVVASVREDGTADVRAATVDDSLQRSGCGRILMGIMENYCRAKGIPEVVLHSRKTALGFYEKLGYILEGEEFIEVTIPHFQVRKKL